MRPETAQTVVGLLREWGFAAHVARVNPYRHGIRIVLDPSTEAVWDTDGASGLEAQVLGDGVLVGYVPTVPGTEGELEPRQIAEIIARTDYDRTS
jgi:hypothetical protein